MHLIVKVFASTHCRWLIKTENFMAVIAYVQKHAAGKIVGKLKNTIFWTMISKNLLSQIGLYKIVTTLKSQAKWEQSRYFAYLTGSCCITVKVLNAKRYSVVIEETFTWAVLAKIQATVFKML